MAPIFITTESPAAATLETPAIIIISVFCYLALVIILVFIRQCCVARGNDADCSGICGKADDTNNCCDCCIAFSQACDCSVPGTNACCDSICGPRKRCDLGDCLTCGLCAGGSSDCCDCCGGFSSPGCSCGCCECPANAVKCEKPDCGEIACLCCTISCKDSGSASTQQPTPHIQYPYPPYDPNQSYPYYPYPYPQQDTSRHPGSYPGQFPPSRPLYGYPSAPYSGRNPTTRQPSSPSDRQPVSHSQLFQSSTGGRGTTTQEYRTSRNF